MTSTFGQHDTDEGPVTPVVEQAEREAAADANAQLAAELDERNREYEAKAADRDRAAVFGRWQAPGPAVPMSGLVTPSDLFIRPWRLRSRAVTLDEHIAAEQRYDDLVTRWRSGWRPTPAPARQTGPCSNPPCDRPAFARGQCDACYRYERRTGRQRPAELIEKSRR